MRWLALLLLMIPLVADARPLSGGGALPSCPWANGTTVGDTLCPPTGSFNNFLSDSSGNFWQFQNSQTRAPPNYDLQEGGGGQGAALKAVLSTVAGSTYNPNRVYRFQQQSTGLDLWFCECSFENEVQAVSPGVLALGHFIDVTSGHAWNDPFELMNNASANDVLHVTAPPAGIAAWDPINSSGFPFPGFPITVNGVTVNFDSGAIFNSNAQAFNGTGLVAVTANGVTLNGGVFTGVNGTAWRIQGQNPTIENATLHDNGGTCLLTGPNGTTTTGTLTIHNLLVYGCATTTPSGYGQDHSCYLSALGGVGAVDPTQEVVDSTKCMNVTNDGWLFKDRPIGTSSLQGSVTTSLIACTSSACHENGAIDWPCGGNHTVTHSIIELNGQWAVDQGGWYINKYGEEVNSSGGTVAGCQVETGATNTLVLDHDYFIVDSTYIDGNFIGLVCQHSSGSACSAIDLTGFGGGAFSCTLTNSVIVGDTDQTNTGSLAAMPMPTVGGCNDGSAGCTLVSHKCTDAHNNRWYDSRTVAATNESWSGTFTDPSGVAGTVNCCAWPWFPPHL